MSDFIPFPQKEYNVIYADPPWRYADKGCNGFFFGLGRWTRGNEVPIITGGGVVRDKRP